MAIYTNTMQVYTDSFSKDNSQKIIGIGSTFVLVGVTTHCFVLKPPKSSECGDMFVMPEIFKAAFKEIDIDSRLPQP